MTAPAGTAAATVAGLGRTALAALQADELVVVDDDGVTGVAARDGDGGPLRLQAFAESERPDMAGDDVTVTPWGPGRYVVSSSLLAESGSVLGTLHLLYTTRMWPSLADRLTTLVRAFARHISVAVENDVLRRRSIQISATLDGMQGLDDLVTAQRPLSAITPRVLSILAPLVGAETGAITLWDEETGSLYPLPGAFGASVTDVASMRGTVRDLRSITARVLTTATPYLSNHAEGDPGILQGYVKLYRLDRLMSVPLMLGDRRIGVLHLANKSSDFDQEDVDLVSRLTPRIATTIELTTVVSTLALRRQYESLLAEAALLIAQGEGLERAVRPALEQFGRLAESSLVALVAPDECPLLWSEGDLPPRLRQHLLDDARAARWGMVDSPASGPGEAGWAAMHVPASMHGQPDAALSALRLRGQPFTSYEHEILERLASLVTLASAAESLRVQHDRLARLQERHRIADDLHDRVAQVLFAALLGIDTILEEDGVDARERRRLDEVRELLVKGDAFVRDTIAQLTPPPKDVVERIERVADDVTEDFGVPIVCDVPEEDAARLGELDSSRSECLVRVAREAVVNAAKHADPSTILLRVRADETQVVLTVEDDGRGLPDPEPANYGIRSMRRSAAEVGGSLDFESGAALGGTLVRCIVPSPAR